MTLGNLETANSKKSSSSTSNLTVAIALVSSLVDVTVRADTACVGEIGLVGELRLVSRLEQRVKEARRMGFSRIIIPATSTSTSNQGPKPRKRLLSKKQKEYYQSQKQQQQQNTSSSGGSASSTIKVVGMEVLECQTLLQAIHLGLADDLPTNKERSRRTKQERKEMLMDAPILDGDDDDDNLDGDGTGTRGTADAYSEVTLLGNAQTGYQSAKSPKNIDERRTIVGLIFQAYP
mmetsp:Transcript_26789/g.32879  ORF Transcript_26789/g.32879 Transcript_26789/m.32879 type:complete len:234 (-) Transcript_26789:295-996(-)